MKISLLYLSILILFTGCISRDDIREISFNSSKEAFKDVINSQKNHYEIYGTVQDIVKKEPLISSGFVPYQYKIQIEPLGYFDKSESQRYFYVTYLSDDEKPIFKLGDRVKLKGWIENFSCDTD